MTERIKAEPGNEDVIEEDYWVQLAQKHWAEPTSKPRKVKGEVVKKEIWDVLDSEAFDFRSLVRLEGLQLLEKYACALVVRGHCAKQD